MNLPQYLAELVRWEMTIARSCPEEKYLDEIVQPWFEDIAPVKAEEYGIECWMKLGVKGLLADTNACFYRWKKLRVYDRAGAATLSVKPMLNALRDCFGYTVMIGVIEGLDPEEVQWRSRVFYPERPIFLNDRLIRQSWFGTEPVSYEDAACMAYNMWARVDVQS